MTGSEEWLVEEIDGVPAGDILEEEDEDDSVLEKDATDEDRKPQKNRPLSQKKRAKFLEMKVLFILWLALWINSL
jgi:hypothetical protein